MVRYCNSSQGSNKAGTNKRGLRRRPADSEDLKSWATIVVRSWVNWMRGCEMYRLVSNFANQGKLHRTEEVPAGGGSEGKGRVSIVHYRYPPDQTARTNFCNCNDTRLRTPNLWVKACEVKNARPEFSIKPRQVSYPMEPQRPSIVSFLSGRLERYRRGVSKVDM